MTNKKKTSYSNSLISPIYQTATYYFQDTAKIIKQHEQEIKLGRYGRYDNPSWLEVEEKVAALDKMENALIFPSGMSAITTSLLTFLGQDDKLLYTGLTYRNIRKLCMEMLSKIGITAVPLYQSDTKQFEDQFKAHYSEDVRLVFIEMPSNPHLYLVDIAMIKEQLRDDTLLIVDSTLSTPINLQQVDFGADLIIHSATKYMAGHGDILAGTVSGSADLIEQIRNYRNVTGAIVDPNTAFFLNRGMKTLPLRMNHLNEVGLKLAGYLEAHDKVRQVYYTALPSHPHHALAKKYLTDHGGVVSFELEAGEKETTLFVDALQIPFMGTNFGLADSMI
ncbi:MAG: Cys/Met metabolism pyridoxal-phosphate-dependent protein, partial [Candidatus Parabeggiatoa sp. nov. 1]